MPSHPDLRDLPDLARDVRERVVVPPYDEVSRRVRERRARGAVGAVAAAVLTIGGVALWQNTASTPGPSLEPVDVPPTDDTMWRQVVADENAHPFETAGADDGSIAVVWRALVQPEPTFALVIREPDGDVHGRRVSEPPHLTPVPGGWVGTHSSRAWFIPSDGGAWQEVDKAAMTRSPRAGDVFVRGDDVGWLYSPDDRSLAPVPELAGGFNDGYVTPAGELVTCLRGKSGVVATVGEHFGPSLPGRSCVLAGRGDHVAMVGLGDAPDGGIPMTGLAIRSGDEWVLPRMATMLGGVTSVEMTAEGSTVITDASTGDWYLIDDDGNNLSTDLEAGEAFVAGDRLYVTSYGFADGPLYASDDGGRTWTETTLPGNESSDG